LFSSLSSVKHHEQTQTHSNRRREEIPQYPETTFREAIVNAVMHRDYYDISGDVMVEVFKNRLTISNPRGLVPWLPPGDIGRHEWFCF
jgi:ATP-dependent DNA helicase RecG